MTSHTLDGYQKQTTAVNCGYSLSEMRCTRPERAFCTTTSDPDDSCQSFVWAGKGLNQRKLDFYEFGRNDKDVW